MSPPSTAPLTLYAILYASSICPKVPPKSTEKRQNVGLFWTISHIDLSLVSFRLVSSHRLRRVFPSSPAIASSAHLFERHDLHPLNFIAHWDRGSILLGLEIVFKNPEYFSCGCLLCNEKEQVVQRSLVVFGQILQITVSDEKIFYLKNNCLRDEELLIGAISRTYVRDMYPLFRLDRRYVRYPHNGLRRLGRKLSPTWNPRGKIS